MGDRSDEAVAQQMLEKATRIEQQFGDALTGRRTNISHTRLHPSLSVSLSVTIDEESLSDVYDRICEVIDREQRIDHFWVPSKEKI